MTAAETSATHHLRVSIGAVVLAALVRGFVVRFFAGFFVSAACISRSGCSAGSVIGKYGEVRGWRIRAMGESFRGMNQRLEVGEQGKCFRNAGGNALRDRVTIRHGEGEKTPPLQVGETIINFSHLR